MVEHRYDYIVIGAGSSGSVVAGKLSANPDISVLLLEAGATASEFPAIWDPNQICCLPNIPDIHWQGYESTKLTHLNDRVMPVLRAKVTGGCTAHNDMVYTRGAAGDYDAWERLYGCAGWRYDEVKNNFAAVEAMLQPTTTTENAFGAAFVSTCLSLGIPYNPDYNSGASMRGVSPIRSTIRSTIDAAFRRVTSYEVYVAPFIGKRLNLTVVTEALVTGIEISGTAATGVRYIVNGQRVTAGVQHEVILSAGAINSPKILMLSGIGDARELRRLGVTTIVADLPGVGKNLQEAIIFAGAWSSAQPIYDQPINQGYAIVWDDMVDRDQPMTCIEMMRGRYTCDQSKHTLEGFYLVTGGAMRLESKGSVALRSLDPWVPPIIDLGLLSAPGDYAQCLKAFELMREIGNAAGLTAWRREEIAPGPNVITPEQIQQWILDHAEPYNHLCGTCGMGKVNQPVLDAELRVLGVQGLRVIDASVMPRITSGHIQAPAFMIGDKGADLILQGH